MDGSGTTSLAPGFRFHPTDEELVSYYLRRKLSGKPFRFDAIGDIDIYKTEPWLLPGLSKLKTRDLEWYFFSGLDKKYGNGSRTNRATDEGYWKTTGKDRAVHHKGRVVGMKKTLVYHRGRAPRGERTNWVMHEYRSIDQVLENAGISQEAFVLCRIFQKSGSGPKNGEKYGAPLLDEEWEDDNVMTMVPSNCGSDEALADDAFLELDDFSQGLDIGNLTTAAARPDFTLYQEDGSNFLADSGNLSAIEEKSLSEILENPHALDFPNDQNFFDLPSQPDGIIDSVKDENHLEQGDASNPASADYWVTNPDAPANQYQRSQDVKNFSDLPLQLEGAIDSVKNECALGQVSDNNPASADYWPTEPTLNAHTGHNQCSEDGIYNDSFDGLFLDADLSDLVDSTPMDRDLFDEFLTYFNAEDNIEQYLSFDAPDQPELTLSGQDLCTEKYLAETTQAPTYGQQVPEAAGNASSSKQNIEMPKSISVFDYPFSKQLSRMLGNIPAPPAYASELPSKAIAAQLNAATQSPGPVHATAGMVRVRDVTLGGNGVQWSLDKLGNVNVVVSFDLPESHGLVSHKMASEVTRGWCCFLFFSVLLLAVSVKMATCIYAK